MSDYISRQEAIDKIDEYDFEFLNYMERFVTELRDAMKAGLKHDIEALPSAQTETCGDVISREYLKEHIEACWINGRPRHAPELNELLSWIDDVPSAQPERPKGRWIPVDSYSAFGGDEATWMAHGNPVAFYYCSECKEQAYAGEDGESLITYYCPYCGAEMDGGDEHADVDT